MNSQKIEQIKSYSKLIVYELHKTVLDEAIFDKLKAVLALAEELECYVLHMERQQKERISNIVSLKRIA